MDRTHTLQAKNSFLKPSIFLNLSLFLQNKKTQQTKPPLVINQQTLKSTDCIRRSISSVFSQILTLQETSA